MTKQMAADMKAAISDDAAEELAICVTAISTVRSELTKLATYVGSSHRIARTWKLWWSRRKNTWSGT
jgi:hypothetical protein